MKKKIATDCTHSLITTSYFWIQTVRRKAKATNITTIQRQQHHQQQQWTQWTHRKIYPKNWHETDKLPDNRVSFLLSFTQSCFNKLTVHTMFAQHMHNRTRIVFSSFFFHKSLYVYAVRIYTVYIVNTLWSLNI